MSECIRCRKESILISSPLNVCADCIRSHFPEVKARIEKLHAESRGKFGLPSEAPRADKGLQCNTCVNRCRVPPGERGYCGVRLNKGNNFSGGTADEANLLWYYDSLPTNCVADWVCPGGTGCGYPRFSHSRGPEYGYQNLAVFFNACSFDCLFCQNWHYREDSLRKGGSGPQEIVDNVDERTSCICYFGGDPAPQILYSLEASRLAMEKRAGRLLRICWETNGSMNPAYLEEMAGIALKSGGCIKFDLKAWHEELHLALCGVTNRQTLSNFELLAKRVSERPEPPLLVASTLLVPGYVDEIEVRKIAEFIASLNPEIPYSLLGFYPHFYMRDLPRTSRRHADNCLKAAREAGLKRVRIGNLHLLGNEY
ncbi:MAG TPA: radical SAM protein [archaeon]|nr:radical SAM protein [archaeon]